LLGGISDVTVMGANALKYVSSPELKRRSRPVEATARR